jgi:hypothetical protein
MSWKNNLFNWKTEVFATRITIEEISLTTEGVSPSMPMCDSQWKIFQTESMKEVFIYCTHEKSCPGGVHAELILDEFRHEGGEPCYQKSFAGPGEVQEEEGRVGDEVAERTRELPDLGEGLHLAVPMGLGHLLGLQGRSPSTQEMLSKSHSDR